MGCCFKFRGRVGLDVAIEALRAAWDARAVKMDGTVGCSQADAHDQRDAPVPGITVMTDTNLPASIRVRLRNLAERDHVDIGSMLTRYALERMLYRLSAGESRETFLLKGALLFDVWFDTPSRPTRDIDLLAFGPADGDRIADVFCKACSLDVPDGITFDPLTVSTTDIRKEAGYPGIRATMRGALDGAQIHVQVDIGRLDRRAGMHPRLLGLLRPVDGLSVGVL